MQSYLKLSVKQLKSLCKENKIIGYSNLNKSKLIDLLVEKNPEKDDTKKLQENDNQYNESEQPGLNINNNTNFTEIDVNKISELKDYPSDFYDFCKSKKLLPPSSQCSRGKALSAMLHNPYKYWTRDSCEEFVKKFDINTRDSIQLFNKHAQWGLKTSEEKGKNYIVLPYGVSNKHRMRKNFSKLLNDSEKEEEINKIKSTIKADYIDTPNSQWQLGHKNPDTTDNTKNNLVLQPPIQAKYRDQYIFIDTLTKLPVASKLKIMISKGEIQLTQKQIDDYFELFSLLKNSS